MHFGKMDIGRIACSQSKRDIPESGECLGKLSCSTGTRIQLSRSNLWSWLWHCAERPCPRVWSGDTLRTGPPTLGVTEPRRDLCRVCGREKQETGCPHSTAQPNSQTATWTEVARDRIWETNRWRIQSCAD